MFEHLSVQQYFLAVWHSFLIEKSNILKEINGRFFCSFWYNQC